MQRTIDSIVIKKLIDKYQTRADDCLIRYYDDKALLEKAYNIKKSTTDVSKWVNPQQEDYAQKDITSMSTQLSVYECVLKDLCKLVGETSNLNKTEEEVKALKAQRMKEENNEVR